jgi:hypothetical protein
VPVKPPPTSGPTTDAKPKTIPKKATRISYRPHPYLTANLPWNTGLFSNGTMGIIIIMEPVKIPADPKPAMARPVMKIGELGAAPHRAEPISKMRTQIKKVLFPRQRWNFA